MNEISDVSGTTIPITLSIRFLIIWETSVIVGLHWNNRMATIGLLLVGTIPQFCPSTVAKAVPSMVTHYTFL